MIWIKGDKVAYLTSQKRFVVLNSDVQDDFVWFPQGEMSFSVSGGYSLISRNAFHQSLNSVELLAVNQIWKTQVPSKIQVFGWRCIKDRIATREQLLKRGILLGSEANVCVFCSSVGESILHLLIHCPFAAEVWNQVCAWAGIDFFQEDSISAQLLACSNCVRGNIPVKKRLLLWLVFAWSIWCKRNAVIFKNEAAVTVEVFEQIRLSSWQWHIIGVNVKGLSNYYLWCQNPMESMLMY
ncbi:uncharacterized protein LOC131633708 [Vicia villosa]|uniref:uncharacterized protein LOC131633708 n=1 Tax=Vicia villosa TaxID=3911 RepID=UPI00273BBF14|nr:uncharacterized protein LOC131633708 [Vicia villosa]